MGSIAYAFLKAVGLDPEKVTRKQFTSAKKEVARRLYGEMTGNKNKDAILVQIYRLGVKLVTNPNVLSIRELMWELNRALRLRDMTCYKKSVIITEAHARIALTPTDKFFMAVFGQF